MTNIEQAIPRQQGPEIGPFALSVHRGTPFRDMELGEIRRLLGHLTHRQQEILRKIVEGVPNKVIAIDLNISQRTVEKHREVIMQKMQVRSLAALVRTIVLYEAYTDAGSERVMEYAGIRNQ